MNQDTIDELTAECSLLITENCKMIKQIAKNKKQIEAAWTIIKANQ